MQDYTLSHSWQARRSGSHIRQEEPPTTALLLGEKDSSSTAVKSRQRLSLGTGAAPWGTGASALHGIGFLGHTTRLLPERSGPPRPSTPTIFKRV